MTCLDQQPMAGYERRTCACGAVFFRHERSNKRTCCACSAPSETVRTEHSGEQRTFASMADVDAYLGGDRIECLLCKRQFMTLGRHLVREHKVTAREYKIRFGLPLSRALSVPAVRAQRSALLKRRIAAGLATTADPARAEKISRIKRRVVRPLHSPAALAAVSQIQRAPASKRRVSAMCSACGADAGLRTEESVLRHGCKQLCAACRKARHAESEQRWLQKIGFDSKSEYMRDYYRRKRRDTVRSV